MNLLRRGSTDEFKAAKKEYIQLADQYETAALKGVALCTRNQLPPLECAKLTVATAAIHTDKNDGVKDYAKAFLVVWAKAGERRRDKPKGFEEAFQKLRDAVGAVVALVPSKEEEEIR